MVKLKNKLSQNSGKNYPTYIDEKMVNFKDPKLKEVCLSFYLNSTTFKYLVFFKLL
jgi:hypothetical protein